MMIVENYPVNQFCFEIIEKHHEFDHTLFYFFLHKKRTCGKIPPRDITSEKNLPVLFLQTGLQCDLYIFYFRENKKRRDGRILQSGKSLF